MSQDDRHQNRNYLYVHVCVCSSLRLLPRKAQTEFSGSTVYQNLGMSIHVCMIIPLYILCTYCCVINHPYLPVCIRQTWAIAYLNLIVSGTSAGTSQLSGSLLDISLYLATCLSLISSKNCWPQPGWTFLSSAIHGFKSQYFKRVSENTILLTHSKFS